MRLVAVLMLAGCWTSAAPRPLDNEQPTVAEPGPACPGCKSLHDRLGGIDAIRAIADELVATIAADARINIFFANADAGELSVHLADQMCQLTGGPCTYAGKPMREAHAGMGIDKAQVAAFLDDLDRALVKLGVPAATRRELLRVYAAMKRDIVGR